MFDALSERLGSIFDGLTGRGALSEKDVGEALREIRVALLEADVALPVVKDFIDKVRVRAVGEEVIRSVRPGQQVIKIVYDALVDMLGSDEDESHLRVDVPPAVVMMAGLQGSGKTTTTGKIAKRLADRGKKRILLASLDVRRPAAMEQLAILAQQAGPNVTSLPIIAGQLPADIARRAVQAAKIGGYDVLFLDTAGRTSIDEQMMSEAAEIDGASPWQQFWLVQVPLARPPILSLAILQFLWTWNSFLLPLVLVEVPLERTMAGALGAFQGQWGTNIPLLCAGALLILAPSVILFLVFQKQFVAALLQGAVKG
jgi:signal recognition particle subunit SRP54